MSTQRNGYFLASMARRGGPHKAHRRDRPPDWKDILREEEGSEEDRSSAQEDTDPGHVPFRRLH